MNQLQSTNSPQTSAQPQSEPCETIDAICRTHGAFKARYFAPAFEGMKPLQSGCPQCSAERQAAEDSNRLASDWVHENLASLIRTAPVILAGDVMVHHTAPPAAASRPRNVTDHVPESRPLA